MKTLVTFYDPGTGEITNSGGVPEGVLDYYIEHCVAVILDVEASLDTHYVQLDPLTVVAYTPEELAAKNEMPTGWIWKMPERAAFDLRTIDAAKAGAWARIKAARDLAEAADFTFEGNVYQADKARISGAALAALMAQVAGMPYSVDWTLSDNSVITLNAEQMSGLGVALMQHVDSVFSTARNRRDQIDAVQPSDAANAALDAIIW